MPQLADIGKLVALCIVIVGWFLLVLFGDSEFTDVTPILTLVVGYLVGEGSSVVRRRAPSSIIVPNVHENEVLTIDGSYPASLEEHDS